MTIDLDALQRAYDATLDELSIDDWPIGEAERDFITIVHRVFPALLAELRELRRQRETARAWLRGELNIDPTDSRRHYCGYCGEMFRSQDESRTHAQQCASNPLVADLRTSRERIGELEKRLTDVKEQA